MANEEHLARLKEALEKKDISIWNKWREEQFERVVLALRTKKPPDMQVPVSRL